ncbi:MAG: hypothetical protein JMDDDDMK_03493 [Acidobacteria bacterium]|nr:hypothetical protein [Acidobacteriota bacterium]
MHARFVFQARVDLVALDDRFGFLNAAQSRFGNFSDLEFPSHSFGVSRVHSQDFSREQAGLFAASSGADFKDDVLLVVRVFGQQQDFQFFFDRRATLFEFGQFGGGQFAHLFVVGVAHQFLCASNIAVELPHLAEFFDHRLKLAALFGQFGVTRLIAYDGRIGHLLRQFFVSSFDGFEFLKHKLVVGGW